MILPSLIAITAQGENPKKITKRIPVFTGVTKA